MAARRKKPSSSKYIREEEVQQIVRSAVRSAAREAARVQVQVQPSPQTLQESEGLFKRLIKDAMHEAFLSIGQ